MKPVTTVRTPTHLPPYWQVHGYTRLPVKQRNDYWRGTAKRLTRINWIDSGGVQTIHRFGHQSGRGERTGCKGFGKNMARDNDWNAEKCVDLGRTFVKNLLGFLLAVAELNLISLKASRCL